MIAWLMYRSGRKAIQQEITYWLQTHPSAGPDVIQAKAEKDFYPKIALLINQYRSNLLTEIIISSVVCLMIVLGAIK